MFSSLTSVITLFLWLESQSQDAAKLGPRTAPTSVGEIPYTPHVVTILAILFFLTITALRFHLFLILPIGPRYHLSFQGTHDSALKENEHLPICLLRR